MPVGVLFCHAFIYLKIERSANNCNKNGTKKSLTRMGFLKRILPSSIQGGQMHFHNRILKQIVLAAAFVILAAGFLQAPRLTGKIPGIVTDEQGAPLPGVTVEVS